MFPYSIIRFKVWWKSGGTYDHFDAFEGLICAILVDNALHDFGSKEKVSVYIKGMKCSRFYSRC